MPDRIQTEIDEIVAPAGRTFCSIAAELEFSTPELLAAFIAHLDIGEGGGGGSGDVVGPASATDNALARFNTTTGKLLQNSGARLSDDSELRLSLAGSYLELFTAGTTGFSYFQAGWTNPAIFDLPAVDGRVATLLCDAQLGTGMLTALGEDAGTAGSLLVLDGGGLVPLAALPAIAVVEYLGTAANQAAMLALSGQKGDWCVRTDQSKVYVIVGDDPTDIADWVALVYPADAVVSVAGRTGAVTLANTDISGLGTLATQSGTFSGTSSGTNTGDVTLAGTADYITISGQIITRALINLTSHVTGVLPHGNLGSGGGGSTKFLREDGTWQTISGGGDALVSGSLDQFANVTQTAGKTLAITENTTLAGGSHSGTNTGDQDLSGLCVKANNLSDLTNAATARGNLGLGSIAVQSANGITLTTPLGSELDSITIEYEDDGISGAGPVKINISDDFAGNVLHIRNTETPADLLALDQTGALTVNALSAAYLAGDGEAITSLRADQLTGGGTVPLAALPAIAVVEYLGTAANQAAMLALSGQKGDWCVRTDQSKVYVIVGDDPTDIADWVALVYPADAVVSVAGRTGAITLSTTDISGLGTLATQNGTFSGTSSGTNTGDQDLSGLCVKSANLSDLANLPVALRNLRARTDLAGGTAPAVNVHYYDTFAADRTITVPTAGAAGDSFSCEFDVTGVTPPAGRTITWSTAVYRVGSSSTTTTTRFANGNHFFSLVWSDGKWWLSDSGQDATTANQVFAGPTSGSADTAAFRALVAADLPSTIPAVTTTGNITLGENTSIALDPAGSADGKYSGITFTGTSGYSMAFGDVVMLDPNQSPARWELASVSAAAGAVGDARGLLAIVVVTGTDGNVCTLMKHGIIRADANFPALTVNAPVYASTTGDVVVTQPTTTDHVIRIIGHAMTADELYFDPGNTWTTHT